MSDMRAYLDHNATAPMRPEAVEAVSGLLGVAGNASSVHEEGRRARKVVEAARETVAGLVGARADMVTFTSGGTEANALAIAGAVGAGLASRLVVSAVEHPSVLEAARAMGVPCVEVPVHATGVIDLDSLDAALSSGDGPALVSVMAANNETGAIQPLSEVVEIARAHDALVHCDAVQAAGRMRLAWPVLGVDMLTLSAHKLGGPQGVGALVARDGLDLKPLLPGGGQERRRRAGTENVAGIAGFAAAVAGAISDMDRMGWIAGARDGLEAAIREEAPAAHIFSAGTDRLANTCCFAVDGLGADMLLIAFDLEGVAVSSGSACSSGKVGRSHVLQAMGAGEELIGGAIRVSLGWSTTQDDIDRFATAWRRIARRNGAQAAA
ncbi:cysteine desulfurase [Kaustia mangrovi]|uniref:Cysteine desulfurase n=1 Tax=Kaustia mangrovi TaxID=2593653 RepID=A0A7S8HDK7_9HYPH|nr:cysteine desulfurase family protein [Kaustia mangrovi]QPC44760.1 cysteine desulfurase [Kaustia mangrovi]